MNSGLFQSYDRTRFETYQQSVERLVHATHAVGAGLVFLIPSPVARSGRDLPEGVDWERRRHWVEDVHTEARAKLARELRCYDYNAPSQYYDDVLAVYADWLATLSNREDMCVVDLRAPLLKSSRRPTMAMIRSILIAPDTASSQMRFSPNGRALHGLQKTRRPRVPRSIRRKLWL